MASIDYVGPSHTHAVVSMEAPLRMSTPPPGGIGGWKKYAILDVFFRVVLFIASMAGIIVLVTSKQTKLIPVAPGMAISEAAKFGNSPAYIYLLVALCTATLYGIIIGSISFLSLMMKPPGTSSKLKFQFLILDSLLLGIMASATGASGGVSYIALKGNSHSNWNKICNLYNSYCVHLGVSVLLSITSSTALLLLVWINVYVLSKKIMRR